MMNKVRIKCRLLLIGISLVALVIVAGCAGIEPYQPRNDREEGPEKGLFSGSEGEFILYRRVEKPENTTTSTKTNDKPDSSNEEDTNENPLE